MRESVRKRNLFLTKGYFPEVLPPCFDSVDLVRSFEGLKKLTKKSWHHQRSSSYVRYSGTKHDGNRRNYGTVNPIPYFNICAFIGEHWKEISEKITTSKFGLTELSLGNDDDERAILIPPLSEVTARLSKQIRYSPFILKTDIAQFFPSIYTHSIPWTAHGIEKSKDDTNRKSDEVYFNRLDWFTQQCQSGQTRGVIIGPDAFRLIAEFIASEIDRKLAQNAGSTIIGAVRHVDDFYIGVLSELDTSVVMSYLRDILQDLELQVNDSKTRVLSGLQAVDDLWAQELRTLDMRRSNAQTMHFAIDKAFELSNSLGSQSPMKLIVRRLDNERFYLSEDTWHELEPKLQRALFHYNHCIDYICLIVAKRIALGREIDIDGWSSICDVVIQKHLNSNHHHEVAWLLWLILVCKLRLAPELLAKLSKVQNGHIASMLIAGHKVNLIATELPIRLGAKLSTDDENWLRNLVARATGYSKAPFTGLFSKEFEHLANKKLRLIDFKKHMNAMAVEDTAAISKSKYGYDSEEEEENIEDDENNYDWLEDL